jgi:hypothetical protein
MDSSDLEPIVNAWVVAQDAADGSPSHEANYWAIARVIDWSIVNPNPELVWQFVLAAYRRDISEHAFGMLAASPLEDLLSAFGPQYIDRVEVLAAEDLVFKHLLSGVWRQGMTDDMWIRVQAARSGVSPNDS